IRRSPFAVRRSPFAVRRSPTALLTLQPLLEKLLRSLVGVFRVLGMRGGIEAGEAVAGLRIDLEVHVLARRLGFLLEPADAVRRNPFVLASEVAQERHLE